MRFEVQRHGLQWLIDRPIAHRGLHDRKNGIIENSALAFAAALDGGYPIECDVQLTSDGEAVVFHDDTLERLTAETGPVKQRTSKELQGIALRGTKDRIPALTELLAQVKGRVPLVIELKSSWDGDLRLARRVLDAVEDYDGPYALMSFDPDIIEEVRYLSPATPRGIVADRATDEYYQHLPLARRLELRTLSHGLRTSPHFVSFRWQDLPFPPVSRCHGLGLPVISWTIRSPAEASQARRYSDQVTFEGYRA
jgi:glycerophosphoryl diester phosphodiesterase